MCTRSRLGIHAQTKAMCIKSRQVTLKRLKINFDLISIAEECSIHGRGPPNCKRLAVTNELYDILLEIEAEFNNCSTRIAHKRLRDFVDFPEDLLYT